MVPPALLRRLAAPVRGERRLRLAADGSLPAAPGLPRGSSVTLELDPALVFLAALDLPEAAAASLPDILRHQLGLLVPLEPAELACSHAIADRDPRAGTIRVALAVVRRRTLAEARAAAQAAGLALRRVEAAGAGGEVFAFGEEAAPSPARRWHRAMEAGALFCLSRQP
jgi:hypothetical protein